MTDSYLRMSGAQRRRLLDQALAIRGWVCCLCGLSIAPGDESLQHIVPRSKGGTNSLENLAPAHRSCNSSAGNRPTSGPAALIHSGLAYFTRPIMPRTTPMPRRVVLLCGPPGAGKTTEAHRLADLEGLTIYDADDEEWDHTHGATFTAALTRVGADPHARAVVISAGATRTARDTQAMRIKATEVRILTEDRTTLVHRVRTRNRPHPPMRQQIAAIDDWLRRFEP
ncbi:HNH endonuclease [Schaalia sp. ZJ1691]|uniref:HNH endonuclease n=1 Tax=Schaalia sp. ZJ1691 TaxID=2709404 RepID=UPI0013ED9342|nr:HNH endonuclease [Schaalia sp. ZJ1691]